MCTGRVDVSEGQTSAGSVACEVLVTPNRCRLQGVV